MKKRILANWTFVRILYLLMGLFVIVQSAISRQWLGILFGGYFASMGLFAFGCAAGNCFGGSCAVDPKRKTTIQGKAFDEVK
jgi:hypothetical protein